MQSGEPLKYKALKITNIKSRSGPVTGERINKVGKSHKIEYYLAMKRNGVLMSTPWMNPENMLFSEGNQSQKTTYYLTPFI